MTGKKGRPKQPAKVPTTEQATWLQEYYKMFTLLEVQKRMKVSEKTLRAFIKHLGLRKKRGPINVPKKVVTPAPQPKQIIRYVPPPKLQRPRADHTNMTREQRIDYWINYPI